MVAKKKIKRKITFKTASKKTKKPRKRLNNRSTRSVH